MNADILEIKETNDGDGVVIVAKVWWRNLPSPKTDETDEQYAERVKDIAEDIASYRNLHIGGAKLEQKPEPLYIPKVDDYYS